MNRNETEALNVFSKSLLKILKVNLSDDSFEIIKSEEEKKNSEKSVSVKFSESLKKFVSEGNVHISDKDAFLKKTELEFLQNFFASNGDFYKIRYRRRCGSDFLWCVMQLCKAPEYSDKKQLVFLYVQDADKEKTNLSEETQTVLSAKAAERLKAEMAKEMFQLKILKSISESFLTMHVINLKNDTVSEFNTCEEVRRYVNKKSNALEQMKAVMQYTISEKDVKRALEFTDLRTIKDRIKDKKIITEEFYGKFRGWIRTSFILIDNDENGNPDNVLFAVSVIDEEKQREQKLIAMSQTDQLSGLLNRHGYEEFLEKLNSEVPAKDLNVISLDLNGLKTVNDTMGHVVGDEMILGISECMKKVFPPESSCFRMGGDEFLAVINCSKEQLQKLLENFKGEIKSWTGCRLKSISVSVGAASSCDFPGNSMKQLIQHADEEMYKSKAEYYNQNGHDRRHR